MAFVHQSVLLMPAVEALAIRPDGIYLDGTLGGAGHSYEIASRLTTGLPRTSRMGRAPHPAKARAQKSPPGPAPTTTGAVSGGSTGGGRR